MDEPIEAVRVGRAYFVVDGHKRVALAKRTGREFLDAQVRHLPSPYELAPDAETEAILRTAREGEFRRHGGLAEALPGARFALTAIDDYGELYESVRAHGLAMAERDNRPPARVELGADWYRSVYEPAVRRAREQLGDLLLPCTDADTFLLMHRQQLAAWGSECDAPECVSDQVRARRRLQERRRLPRVRRRAPTDPAPLLPLRPDSDPDRSPTHGS